MAFLRLLPGLLASHRGEYVAIHVLNSTTGQSAEDRAAFNLIMKDKERLLSFNEPVSFIFSHSALREGWDNPNVCQICTLNQSVSEVKKRQEVGRGMQLVVNERGLRVLDEKPNVLTVIANESYEQFVATLQQEMEEAFGKEGAAPRPVNARHRQVARRRTRRFIAASGTLGRWTSITRPSSRTTRCRRRWMRDRFYEQHDRGERLTPATDRRSQAPAPDTPAPHPSWRSPLSAILPLPDSGRKPAPDDPDGYSTPARKQLEFCPCLVHPSRCRLRR